MLCYVMLCYVMLCYVILYYIILYYIILYYIILYYIILYYIILYYIILYYITDWKLYLFLDKPNIIVRWSVTRSEHLTTFIFKISITRNSGARGAAVGWGTALQTGRSRVRFPMVSSDFFHWHNPSGRTMPLGSTQPLTEMSTRNVSCGVKAAGPYGWQPYHLRMPIVLKSGSLNLPEPLGLVQACNGIVLPLSHRIYLI